MGLGKIYGYGVDIASYQGLPVWAKVKAGGFHFAYVKTTQFPGYYNPLAKQQRQTAFQAGLFVGNYCYCAGNRDDGVAQAQFFLSHSEIQPWHLLPFLDLEENGSEGATRDELTTCAMDWGNNVAKFLKVPRLILYTDQNMLRNRIRVTRALQKLYMLDLADWTLGPPPNLRGWDIIMQQYDTSRNIAGISGPVDKDRVYVSLQSLQIASNREQPPPKPQHNKPASAVVATLRSVLRR